MRRTQRRYNPSTGTSYAGWSAPRRSSTSSTSTAWDRLGPWVPGLRAGPGPRPGRGRPWWLRISRHGRDEGAGRTWVVGPFGPSQPGKRDRWSGQRDRCSRGGPAGLGWSTRIRRRTRLSTDTPARHVFVIGVEGRLDAVSGVRLLRLLDTRLTLTSAAAPPTRCVLIDLTGLNSSDSGGVRSVDRAYRTAKRHDVALALIADEELWTRVPSGDRTVSPQSPPSRRSAKPCRRSLLVNQLVHDDRTPVSSVLGRNTVAREASGTATSKPAPTPAAPPPGPNVHIW